ncbi:30S ribosomal protein S4e [Candidatus Woesearchaeota archaeon]|nr:30S ribosomal protein S4e [Candidatus Woesearchaeota archaeon]
MKKHMKRLAAPKSWRVARKTAKFVTRPLPGSHKKERGMPLNIIIRDILKMAGTAKEAKAIIKGREMFVDGKRVKEEKYLVGLMDTLSIPETGDSYRMVIDARGKLSLIRIPAAESGLKICRIDRKTTIKNGVIQVGLHDGRVMLAEKKDAYRTGDSILMKLPGQEMVESIPLEKKSLVYLVGGKHTGSVGMVEDIRGKTLAIKIGGEVVETMRKFAFAIGKEKPEVSIKE